METLRCSPVRWTLPIRNSRLRKGWRLKIWTRPKLWHTIGIPTVIVFPKFRMCARSHWALVLPSVASMRPVVGIYLKLNRTPWISSTANHILWCLSEKATSSLNPRAIPPRIPWIFFQSYNTKLISKYYSKSYTRPSISEVFGQQTFARTSCSSCFACKKSSCSFCSPHT